MSQLRIYFQKNGLTLQIENAGLSKIHAKFSFDESIGGFQITDFKSELGKKNKELDNELTYYFLGTWLKQKSECQIRINSGVSFLIKRHAFVFQNCIQIK